MNCVCAEWTRNCQLNFSDRTRIKFNFNGMEAPNVIISLNRWLLWFQACYFDLLNCWNLFRSFWFCFSFGCRNAGTKGIGNRFDEQRLTLRIHRGRGSNYHESSLSNGSTHSTSTSIGSSSPERHAKFSTRKHDKIKISVSYPSSENITSPSAQKANLLYAVRYSSNGKDLTSSKIFRGNDDYLQVVKSLPNLDKGLSPRTSKKMGKRNIKAQVKRFRMETKAAKTLGIVSFSQNYRGENVSTLRMTLSLCRFNEHLTSHYNGRTNTVTRKIDIVPFASVTLV